MGLNMLGYEHLLQRCHSARGNKGSSHLLSCSCLRFVIAIQVQHSPSLVEFYYQPPGRALEVKRG